MQITSKKIISIKLWPVPAVLLLSLFFIQCKKADIILPGGTTTSGNFNAGGTSYSGNCVSIPDVGSGGPLGNIDVTILTPGGQSFIVYNMPKTASGNFAFTDGYANVGGSNLCGSLGFSSNDVYASKPGGTLTKSGVKSFTFSCTVYNIITNQNISVTGSGNY
jgi:hypothetical protein